MRRRVTLTAGLVVVLISAGAPRTSCAASGTEFYAAALVAYSASNFAEAVTLAERALKHDPGLWQAWQLDGNARYALGDLAGSLTAFERALAINPRNAELAAFVASLRRAMPGSSLRSARPPDVPATTDELDRVEERIRRGNLLTISRVLVRGLRKTKEKVVRRELLVRPGERLRQGRIRRSAERILNLGIFQDVKVYAEMDTEPGTERLVFEVKERLSGCLLPSGGYSSQYGLILGFFYKEADFLGLGIHATITAVPKIVGAGSYYDPYFWDLPVSVGVGFWDTRRPLINASSLWEKGLSTEIGHRFWDDWRATLGYQYELSRFRLEGSPSNGDPLATSSPSLSLTYDSRDDIFDPYRGWAHGVVGEVASISVPSGGSLGATFGFSKIVFDTSHFEPSPFPLMPFIRAPSLALHSRFGRVWGLGGQEVPVSGRFFLGGMDSIRGFGARSLSGTTLVGSASGGTEMWQFNAEAKWPLVRRVLTLALPFYDIGNTWMIPPSLSAITGQGFPLAQSWGIGLHLSIPATMLVVDLDYGWSLTKYYVDRRIAPRNGNLEFNFRIL